MVKISVIVPVYNNDKYLRKCLQSIVSQTFTDIEIICINDGSTDNSLEILKDFARLDNRIIIIDGENKGVSCARNAGLAVANGEYAGFVDSDDWIDADFYEKLYTAAKKHNADIAVCGIKRLRRWKWKYHLKFAGEVYTEDNNMKFLLCDVPDKCYVWNKIYKLEELRKHAIDFEVDVYYEDRYFTAQALVYLKSLVVVPDTYYNYWTNNNSIVKTKSARKDSDSKYTKEKTMHFLKSNNINLDHYFKEIKKFKIFGLTVMKVKYYKDKKEYLLFNQIHYTVKAAVK